MTQKSLNVTWHDHLQHISGLFQDLYENKKLIDVTLYCTGGSLKAHKIVLSACSPYFAKIFQEVDIQHPIIILKGISFNEMHLLLEFMYKGSINILENELDSLIQAGSYLEIKGMDVKNIPSNMKNTTKRAAEEAAEVTNELAKKKKEDPGENVTSTITTMAKEMEQKTKDVVIKTTESETNDPTTPESKTNDPTTPEPKTNEPFITEFKIEATKTEPTTSEATEPTTPEPKTLIQKRETRFKGQKRVDVRMLTKNYKYYDEVSPKQTKKSEMKGKTSVPVNVKKDEKHDKAKLSRTLDENDKTDKKESKAKLNITAPATVTKKSQENKSKAKPGDFLDVSSITFEDTLSKIVIKDVYSQEVKTSTPLKKSKQAMKKEPDTDNEVINVTPDVVMNESDAELHIDEVDVEGSDEYDDDEDNDDANGYDDEDPESELLQVNHLECSQCKKVFNTDEEFSDHMKTHSGKPYKCDYCDSYFQRMSHLIRHRRTHTGEKPFSCRECGKCFSRQDKLKLHIRVHDENEYKPPPHLRRKYELPLPSDVKRRGRPKKNPLLGEQPPKEKRPRGDEHVENYDITNLPFGDFSYLTSSLPDFSDLTIIPVAYVNKEETTPDNSIRNEDNNESQRNKNKELIIEESKEMSITVKKPDENKIKPQTVVKDDISIISINDKETVMSNNDITILNVSDKKQSPNKAAFPASVKHLGECTIEAVTNN